MGYFISCDLSNKEDVERDRNKFCYDFNVLLRKFGYTNISVKLFLFKQYCLQFYGPDLWDNNRGILGSLKVFSIGYHKCLKKLLGLSMHESNHFACQEARLLTFDHLINKLKITFVFRILMKKFDFLDKFFSYLLLHLCS